MLPKLAHLKAWTHGVFHSRKRMLCYCEFHSSLPSDITVLSGAISFDVHTEQLQYLRLHRIDLFEDKTCGCIAEEFWKISFDEKDS